MAKKQVAECSWKRRFSSMPLATLNEKHFRAIPSVKLLRPDRGPPVRRHNGAETSRPLHGEWLTAGRTHSGIVVLPHQQRAEPELKPPPG